MQYKQLGNSDLQISRIGFGCMSLSPDRKEDGIWMVHHVLELRINYFDTADLYNMGMNEKLVGEALKSKRNKVIVVTKVGNQWRADGSGWDWNPGKEYILKSVEDSLRRLQTDYLDLYQLHGGTIDDPIDEVIEVLNFYNNRVRSVIMASLLSVRMLSGNMQNDQPL